MAKNTTSTRASRTSSSEFKTEKESKVRPAHAKRLDNMTALIKQCHQRMLEGSVMLEDVHPIVGHSYQRLSHDALKEFLANAQIMDEDARFVSFSMLIGTHGRKKIPFVCIKNRLEGGMHMLIGGDE
jgi:cystathionine beta-lyase family protein involved in aluminum resistance